MAEETRGNRMDADELAGQGLTQALGIEFRELTPERVIATMPVTSRHHQPLGYLHGGASVALAETVASVGAFLNCPAGTVCFGQEINANHVRAVQSGILTAISTPLHLGRTTQVWDVKIYDERDKLVCVSRCTIAVVAERRPAGEQPA